MGVVRLLVEEEGPERFTGEWWTGVLLDKPLRLAGLILLTLVIRYLLHKVIARVVERTVDREPPTRVLGSATAARIVFGSAGAYSQRRALRVQTMGSLLKSTATIIIGAIAVVMALDILGYSIGPVLASAGIVGVALGFGAQNLVKDFLAGISMLLEDQYGVGDVIDMGEASGVVEAVSLRVTRLRSVDGTVWYVRNGEVMRLGNSSQDWARAVIDVGVAYASDTADVRRLLEEISHDLAAEDVWKDLILEEPEVWGVEALSADSIVIRLVVKTKPLEQWKVGRELRERIKRRFDAEGIEIPFPQRTLWIKEDTSAEGAPPSTPDGAGPAPESPVDDTAEEQRRKASRPPEPEVP
ncbi:mechanosensitive ion channel family protein [Phytoactinopolyspora alkaliphila]|uniref:Mechanosensitive ion channel family protein n=1 Tax=Phytoactinopolyspora alkaliphila TaxID=1783498 RepID=A0A6N9YRN9_9ACTN|nr:mechanosensitive ion channel family protein [Phytoactinopolyspora alkaliphila]NED97469.1 mechanosensitive ion channel family protein [Phytoactinopolyspora alkaliphila]